MASQTKAGRRILVVDDEESVGYFLRESLNKVRREYQVELACSAQEALRHLDREPFDLVITDLRMPGIDGLQLIEEVRRQRPQTRLILMTAYGNAAVEATAYRLGACRYISKPFSIGQLVSTVAAALEEPAVPGHDVLLLSDDESERIAHCLADLRFEVGAQCILLADVVGQMVAHVGEMPGLDLTPLVSLVGGSFATSFEMSRYLGERHALTLNYHEGERYDVYSSNVDEELFIVLIFDREQQRSRVGVVWLYARRTLGTLRDLFANVRRVSPSEILDPDFGSLLSDSMDQLLDPRSQPPAHPADPLPATFSPPTSAPVPDRPGRAQPDTPCPAPEPAADEDDKGDDPQTFSLRQALEMGLLDPAWLDDHGGQRS